MKKRVPGTLVAALVVAVLLIVGAVAYATGLIGDATVSADEFDRVLLVAASEDESGAVVAQIIAVADLSGAEAALEPISPVLRVTIPGTSFSELKDAYPFGGGRGTARALARAEGGDALPYVAISGTQLADAVRAAGGVSVRLPVPLSVFDGERLFTLQAGTQQLDADELQAVFKGAAYLTAAEREKLDAALTVALQEALAASPETIDAADTNLDESARARLKAAL